MAISYIFQTISQEIRYKHEGHGQKGTHRLLFCHHPPLFKTSVRKGSREAKEKLHLHLKLKFSLAFLKITPLGEREGIGVWSRICALQNQAAILFFVFFLSFTLWPQWFGRPFILYSTNQRAHSRADKRETVETAFCIL